MPKRPGSGVWERVLVSNCTPLLKARRPEPSQDSAASLAAERERRHAEVARALRALSAEFDAAKVVRDKAAIRHVTSEPEALAVFLPPMTFKDVTLGHLKMPYKNLQKMVHSDHNSEHIAMGTTAGCVMARLDAHFKAACRDVEFFCVGHPRGVAPRSATREALERAAKDLKELTEKRDVLKREYNLLWDSMDVDSRARATKLAESPADPPEPPEPPADAPAAPPAEPEKARFKPNSVL